MSPSPRDQGVTFSAVLQDGKRLQVEVKEAWFTFPEAEQAAAALVAILYGEAIDVYRFKFRYLSVSSDNSVLEIGLPRGSDVWLTTPDGQEHTVSRLPQAFYAWANTVRPSLQEYLMLQHQADPEKIHDVFGYEVMTTLPRVP